MKLCSKCEEPHHQLTKMCITCLIEKRADNKRMRLNKMLRGECAFCKKSLDPSSKRMCTEHLIRNRIASRVNHCGRPYRLFQRHQAPKVADDACGMDYLMGVIDKLLPPPEKITFESLEDYRGKL